MKKTLFLLMTPAVLSGCTAILGDNNPFRDRTSDYLLAEVVAPMRVPEGMDSEVVGELYRIPEVGQVNEYQLDTSFKVPRAQVQISDNNEGEVKIQRLGDDSWILISVPPGETWPRVRNFLATSGIPTASANASSGIIESGWVGLIDSPDILQQFRFKLEQGVQLNTTEIEVQQRQYAADAMPPQLPAWLEVSDDADMESLMRTNLAEALAEVQNMGSASLLGQEIGAAVKVVLETPANQTPYLRLMLPRDRAWASIGYALDTVSFDEVTRDSDSGTANFEFYEEPPREISTLAWLFGRRNPKPTSWSLELIEDADGYRVTAKRRDSAVTDPRDVFILLTRIRNTMT